MCLVLAVFRSVVDVNEVVVGANGEFASIAAESHNFDPLLGVVGLTNDIVQVHYGTLSQICEVVHLAN